MIDIRMLLPDGNVVTSRGIVTVGENSLAYSVLGGSENTVEIAYFVDDGAEARPRHQRIELVPSWPRFEALGWWFSCPCCGRRVEKLYLPDAKASFACRRCSGLTYTSTQTHDDRVNKLRRDPRCVVEILSGKRAASETEYALALKAAVR